MANVFVYKKTAQRYCHFYAYTKNNNIAIFSVFLLLKIVAILLFCVCLTIAHELVKNP